MTTKKNPVTRATIVELDGSSYVTGTSVESINPVLTAGEIYNGSSSFTEGTLQALAMDVARYLKVTDKSYDPVSDANKGIPVYIPQDRYETSVVADDSAADAADNGTYYYYVDMEGTPYGAIEVNLDCTSGGAGGGNGQITGSVQVSLEADEADTTARSYTADVTSLWGFSTSSILCGSGSTQDEYVELDTPTMVNSIRFTLVVAGLTDPSDTVSWEIRMKKGVA